MRTIIAPVAPALLLAVLIGCAGPMRVRTPDIVLLAASDRTWHTIRAARDTTGEHDVNAVDRHGKTPLIYAAIFGHGQVVDTLLAAGADPVYRDPLGANAWHYALAWERTHSAQRLAPLVDTTGGEGIVEQLRRRRSRLADFAKAVFENRYADADSILAAGLDIDQPLHSPYGNDCDGTLLTYAIDEQLLANVEYLLRRGADIDRGDDDGKAGLLLVWNMRSAGMVQLLLDHGADVNARTEHGSSPLSRAIDDRAHETARILIQNGACVDCRAEYGEPPLALAIGEDDSLMVELLLQAGATVDTVSERGFPILHYALDKGNRHVARRLLKGGADPDRPDSLGRQPLAIALGANDSAMVDLLAAYGLQVTDSVLQHAAGECSTSVFRTLHRHASSLLNDTGVAWQCYIEAIRGRKPETVALLLDAGVPLVWPDSTNYDPILEAARNGDTTTIRLLVKRGYHTHASGSDGPSPVAAAAGECALEIVRMLLENGSGVQDTGYFGRTPLHAAAWHGCDSVTAYLLKAGASVQATDRHGQTPLHRAAAGGRPGVIDMLLGKGADPAVRDERGYSCFDHAAASDDALALRRLARHRAFTPERKAEALLAAINGRARKAARWLLAHQAPLSARDEHGGTPLHLSVRQGWDELSVELMKRDPQWVRTPHNYGSPALMEASRKGHAALCRTLLERGARVSATDTVGRSALSLASSDDVRDLLLEKGADVNVTADDGLTPLVIDALYDQELLDAILARNVRLDCTDAAGRTPLTVAIVREDSSQVRQFLAKGADPLFRSGMGHAPLAAASSHGYDPLVKQLLDAGATVGQRGWHGQTALMLAAHEAVAERLIAAGASIDETDEGGNTALHYALSRGDTAIAQLLLNKGADCGVRSKAGELPLSVAAGAESVALVQRLIDCSKPTRADLACAIMFGASSGSVAVCSLLVEHGAPVSGLSRLGRTPLMEAVLKEQAAVVGFLLQRGAPANESIRGMTPLMIASGESDTASLKFLLEAGADVRASSDGVGRTALHFAALHDAEGSARVLVRAGADVDMRTPDGITPLMEAVRGYNEATAKSLLELGADPARKDKAGHDAVWYAREGKSTRMTELLEEGAHNQQ